MKYGIIIQIILPKHIEEGAVMKQFQIAYHEEACFRKELQDFKSKCEKDGMSKVMFQIYS